MSTITAIATQWHKRPGTKGDCPICGCPFPNPGDHRQVPNTAPPAWEKRCKSSTGWQFIQLGKVARPSRKKPDARFSLFDRQDFELCADSITAYFERQMAPRYVNRGTTREIQRAIFQLRRWRGRDVALQELDNALLIEFRSWLGSEFSNETADKLAQKIRFIWLDWQRKQGPQPSFEPEKIEPEEPQFNGTIPDLYQVLRTYVILRSVSPEAEYQLRHSIDLFRDFLEQDPTVLSLTDEIVSGWLKKLESILASRTVAGHRGNLLSLWKLAHEEYNIRPPKRVRKVRKSDPLPIAWTMTELNAIIEQCKKLEGSFTFSGVPKSLYCVTLIRFCYETGLRRSDVWAITMDQIRADGSIFLRQHKTGHRHTPRIRTETMNGIIRLRRDPPLANPYAGSKAWYRFWKRQVIEPAGVRPGGLHQLRRTGATHLARTHGLDAARRFLGHRSPEMVRHYVDESISMPDVPLPPMIEV